MSNAVPEQAVEAIVREARARVLMHVDADDARAFLTAALPFMGVQREAIKQAVLREIVGCNHMIIDAAHDAAERSADAVLALPHTGQPQAADNEICAACGERKREHAPGGTRWGPTSLCGVFIPADPPEQPQVTFCYVTYRACTAACPTRENCALGKVMARIDAAPVAEKREVQS